MPVVCGKRDAAANEADGANGAENAPFAEAAAAYATSACGYGACHAVCRWGGGNVVSEDVFGGNDDRVAVECAVVLHADQRAFAACEVVFDDEVGAVAVVKADEQVIAVARGVDAYRAGAGRGVGELVVRTVDGVDLLDACGVEVDLVNGVAFDVFDVEYDLCHVSLY